MRKEGIILTILLGALTAVGQEPAHRVQLTPYLDIQGFRWEELEGGEAQVREIGSRYSFGVNTQMLFLPSGRLVENLDLRVTTGSVEYDGLRYSSDGSSAPYTTHTSYTGLDGNISLGYAFNLSSTLLLTPTAKIEVEYWHRNLDYQGPYGYTEKYLVTSAGGGARLSWTPGKSFSLFTTAFLTQPLLVSESFMVATKATAPLSVLLHPGINPQITFEAGMQIGRLFLVFSTQTWNLARSDVNYMYYQPESHRRQVDGKIGYTIGLW